MRERTKITKSLISNLPKLKFIMTSGTKMSYAGLKSEKERAAVILYMNENTNSPLPIN